MKKVSIGTSEFTEVWALDEPGQGGACHEYTVRDTKPAKPTNTHSVFASVSFQEGPIKVTGINGCHNEDLIAIVMHRLECFQSGEFACEKNAQASVLLRRALTCLGERTKDRKNRGVEGTSKL